MLCTLLTVSAQTKTYQFHFTTPYIWDLTGNSSVGTPGDMTYMHTDHSAQGILTATEKEISDSPTSHVEVNSIISGKVSNSGFVTRVNGKIQGYATGTYDGRSISAQHSGTLKGTISAPTHQLILEIKDRLCVYGSKCTTTTQGFSLDLGDKMDGSWDLELELARVYNKVSGAAKIKVSTGRAFPYLVSGSANARTGSLTLRLTGTGEAQKTSFVVSLENETVTKVSGKLLGQSVKLP